MKATVAISLAIAFAAGPAFADCTAPNDSVVIPNGAAATKDEMIAAQTAVKKLDADVGAYGDCLKQDEDAKVAAGGDKAKIHAEYAKLANDQVAKLQEVANKFNEELHAYNAKNAAKK